MVIVKSVVSDLKMHNSKLLRKEFTGKNMSRNQIVNLVKDQQKSMKKYKKDVNYMISVYTPDEIGYQGKSLVLTKVQV
jgi:hypothetical protein